MSLYDTKADFYHARLMEQVEREIASSKRLRPRKRFVLWAPAVSLAALAVVIAGLFFIFGNPPSKTAESNPSFSIKGPISFEVFAKRGPKLFRVKPHAELMQGDALRFVLTTDSAGFAAVLSVDSKGKLSLFYPDSQNEVNPTPINLGAPGRFEFPGSIILDSFVGQETYLVIFSKEKFAPQQFYDLFRSNNDKKKMESLKKRLLKQGVQFETLVIKKINKKQ